MNKAMLLNVDRDHNHLSSVFQHPTDKVSIRNDMSHNFRNGSFKVIPLLLRIGNLYLRSVS